MRDNTPRKRLDRNSFDYGALQLKEAEAGALGAILLDPDTATKNLRQLNRNMFADLRHMKIFETLRLLNAEEVVIDENVLIQSLKREGDDALDEAGGLHYILQLSDYCPSASNFSYFFDQLKDYEARRAIYRDTQDALKLIADPKKAPTEILEEFQKTVSKRLRQSINGKSAIRFVSPLEARRG
jgi:replicative DNA helicase